MWRGEDPVPSQRRAKHFAEPSFANNFVHTQGIASSAVPYSRTPPAWLKTTPDQVVDQIYKLAKYVYLFA